MHSLVSSTADRSLSIQSESESRRYPGTLKQQRGCREMLTKTKCGLARSLTLSLLVSVQASSTFGQNHAGAGTLSSNEVRSRSAATPRESDARAVPEPGTIALSPRDYLDPMQGASSIDLVRRALASNAELGAARLDLDRARARLRQALLMLPVILWQGWETLGEAREEDKGLLTD